MEKTAILLGANNKASVVKQMNEVLQFERNLARIYEPKGKLRDSDKIYNKMTIADLQQMAPSVCNERSSSKKYRFTTAPIKYFQSCTVLSSQLQWRLETTKAFSARENLSVIVQRMYTLYPGGHLKRTFVFLSGYKTVPQYRSKNINVNTNAISYKRESLHA